MAKKSSGPNKSAAIRQYKKDHPDAMPMAISAELKKQGVVVSTAFVSTVLSTDKRKGGTLSKRGPKKGSKRKSAKVKPAPAKSVKPAAPKATARVAKGPKSFGGEVSLESLLKVKKIVEEMGGVEDARNALMALEKLMG